MKLLTVVLLLLVLEGGIDAIIRKRLSDTSKNDTFHINVSAGYGVQEGNLTTKATPVKNYQFTERRVKKDNETAPINHQDQISQPSITANQVIPTYATYQVHESTPELQEKVYHVGNRYRSQQHFTQSKARPTFNELQNVVNSLEHNSMAPYGRPPKGSKIVEVVRVPAIYELHLQSGNQEAQRFVTLNPWVNKLNGFMQDSKADYQYKQQQQFQKPQQYPQKNFAQQQNIENYNLAHHGQQQGILYQTPFNNAPQSWRMNLAPPEVTQHHHYQSDLRTVVHNKPIYKNFGRHQQHQQTMAWDFSQQINQDMGHDFYKKPQALHEVPAPSLNRPAPHGFVRAKTTPTPSVVYVQPSETPIPYQHTTQPMIIPGLWYEGNNVQTTATPVVYTPDSLGDIRLNTITTNYHQRPQYSKGQVDTVPNDYYQQSYVNDQSGINFDKPIDDGNYLQTQHFETIPQQPQTYIDQTVYNGAIGDYLDQNLMKTQPAMAYTAGISEDTSYGYSNYNTEIAPTESTKIETIENHYQTEEDDGVKEAQQIFTQHVAPDINLFLTKNQGNSGDNSGESIRGDYRKFESMKLKPVNYYGHRPMNPRPFRTQNRRNTPMDYIIYIKERTIE